MHPMKQATVTLGTRHLAQAFGLPHETFRAWLRREVVSFRRAPGGVVLAAPELAALNVVCALRQLGVRGHDLGVAFDRVRVEVRRAAASGAVAFAWMPSPKRLRVVLVPREKAEAVRECFPVLDLSGVAAAYAGVLAELAAVRLPAFERRDRLARVNVAALN